MLGTCCSFLEDPSGSSSEDGSEVAYRCELSGADLPVHSVWVGDAIWARDSSGHRYHTADGFG